MDTTITRSKVPLGGLIILILLGVVGAVAAGAIAAAIEMYGKLYLIVAFPIFEGFIVGAALVFAIKAGKVRSVPVVVLIGLLVGLITYSTYWYVDYYAFKQEDGQGQDRAEFDQQFDAILVKETGQPGALGYLMYTAQEGFGITSSSGSSATRDFTLIGPTAYGYYAVELLLIALIAASMAYGAARTRYCAKDNRFFVKQNLGRVPKDATDQFVTMIRAGDWKGASLLLEKASGKIRYPYIDVTASKCPVCNTNMTPVTVIYKKGSRKNSQRVVYSASLKPEQVADLIGLPVSEANPVMAY